MKKLINIFTLFLLIFPFSSLYAIENLKCSTTDYSQLHHAYNVKWMRSWVSEKFEVSINGNDAVIGYRKGKVTTDNNSRIAITHKHFFKKKSQSYANIKFIYFKTTSKFTVSIQMPNGFHPSGNIWGTCEYIISSSSNNNTNSQNAKKIEPNLDSKQKEIINQDFKLIRGSSGTDLFYNQETSTLLVKNNSKYYNKMHKKLIDNPNYDIRIGSFWDKESKKPKKYMFQYKKPEKIFANLNGYIREIYVQDSSVSDILSEKEKYLYVSITDYDDGMWVATRTEKPE